MIIGQLDRLQTVNTHGAVQKRFGSPSNSP
jgi:hypothetical protein